MGRNKGRSRAGRRRGAERGLAEDGGVGGGVCLQTPVSPRGVRKEKSWPCLIPPGHLHTLA